MKTTNNRLFNCKDEELPVCSKYLIYSLKRDLDSFTSFSPKFNKDYVTGFETKITAANDLLEPLGETLAKKIITDRLYTSYFELIDPVNRTTEYLKMSKKSLKVTPAAFGLTALRKSINVKDAEGIVDNLNIVTGNIQTYRNILSEQGLTDELVNKLVTGKELITADKQKQYEITTNRKSIVQNNVSLLNDLYAQMSEIFSVGKILYKATDPAKLSEYTFTELRKKVRKTAKSTETASNSPETTSKK